MHVHCWQRGVIGMCIVHYDDPPASPSSCSEGSFPVAQKAGTSCRCPRSLGQHLCTYSEKGPHCPAGDAAQVQKWGSRAEVTQSPMPSINTRYAVAHTAVVGGWFITGDILSWFKINCNLNCFPGCLVWHRHCFQPLRFSSAAQILVHYTEEPMPYSGQESSPPPFIWWNGSHMRTLIYVFFNCVKPILCHANNHVLICPVWESRKRKKNNSLLFIAKLVWCEELNQRSHSCPVVPSVDKGWAVRCGRTVSMFSTDGRMPGPQCDNSVEVYGLSLSQTWLVVQSGAVGSFFLLRMCWCVPFVCVRMCWRR